MQYKVLDQDSLRPKFQYLTQLAQPKYQDIPNPHQELSHHQELKECHPHPEYKECHPHPEYNEYHPRTESKEYHHRREFKEYHHHTEFHPQADINIDIPQDIVLYKTSQIRKSNPRYRQHQNQRKLRQRKLHQRKPHQR